MRLCCRADGLRTNRAECIAIIVPLAQQKLQSTDWMVRESAILAIGAIADGCYEQMVPSLPSLFPFLWNTMEDQQVRSVSVLVSCCALLRRVVLWVRYAQCAQCALLGERRSDGCVRLALTGAA